jgi:ferredoxin
MTMAVKLSEEKCNGCGACKDICPMEAIEIKDGKAVINDLCVECGACVPQCPNNALTL